MLAELAGIIIARCLSQSDGPLPSNSTKELPVSKVRELVDSDNDSQSFL
jgi:hypothetical protein